ncbi:MAG TPA: hypothetical protein VK610_00590 [Rhodothermales bacterium]|nr:hypothetical protein [Rhodothermales bacterium]
MLPSTLTLGRTYPVAPVLGSGSEKPLYRRWWFIAAFVSCGLAFIGSFLPSRAEESASPTAERERPQEATRDRAILDPAVVDEVGGR